MMISIEVMIMVTMTMLGGLGSWVYFLQGRLSAHEAGCVERQKNLDERHANIEKLLARVETKLDALARDGP